jgi:hypothetical protein
LEQCFDWPTLLGSVAQETKHIREARRGREFLQIIAALQKVPGMLPSLLRWPRCMATAVLTNLGDTTRRFRKLFPIEDRYPIIGNVRLQQVNGTPPLRPGTHVGVGICICAGHLAVSLRCDPAHFDAESSTAFLKCYVEAWRAWSVEANSSG